MTIGERLKKLRKEIGLTQQEFSDKIKVSRSNIATYEVGKNNPTDAVVNLICREFHVNETWLRTGKGEMFNQEAESTVDRLCAELGASELDAEIIRAYFKIDPSVRREFMTRLIQGLRSDFSMEIMPQETITPEPIPIGYSSREKLEAEADNLAAMVREQYLSEKSRELQASSAKESDVV